MNALLFIVQAVAWPAAVAFAVWRVTRAVEEYARLMAAEYRDSAATTAEATAAKALKTAQAAQSDWLERAARTEDDIAQLKSALMR